MSGPPDRPSHHQPPPARKPSVDSVRGRSTWVLVAAVGGAGLGTLATVLVVTAVAETAPVSGQPEVAPVAALSPAPESDVTAEPARARALRPPIAAAAETDLPDRWALRLRAADAQSPGSAPGGSASVGTLGPGPSAAVPVGEGSPEQAAVVPASEPRLAAGVPASEAAQNERGPATRLKAARVALQLGRLEQADAELRTIAPDAPEAAEAIYLLGETAHRRGDLALARSHFNDAARRGGAGGALATRALSVLGRATDLAESGALERSTHFALRVPSHSRGGSIARGGDILRTLEHALDRILRDLPTVPDREIPVFVLSVEEFDQRFAPPPGTVLYGVYVPGERAIYVNDALGNSADRKGRDTLAHELTHALVDRTTAGRQTAVWLNEGLARYEGRRSVDLEPLSPEEWAELKARAISGTLPALATVRHSLGDGLIAYRLGAAACVLIVQRFGVHHIVRYFGALRGGSNHDEAFREAFNTDEARFESELREWLKSR